MVQSNDELTGEMVQRIVDTVHPLKVILFGSRARGQFRSRSDYDFLVVSESNQPRYRRSVPLYMALADVPAEVEVMVYTPGEIEEWSAVPRAFVTTAMREGKVLFDRSGSEFARFASLTLRRYADTAKLRALQSESLDRFVTARTRP